LDQTTSLRQNEAGWVETISKMVNLGTQGTDAELNAILNYLAKFYGAAGDASPASARNPSGSEAAITTGSTGASAPNVQIASRLPHPAASPQDFVPRPNGSVDPGKEWRTYGHDPG